MKMSTYTHVPFCRCFGVPIVEPSKFLAVCRVFVTACQTPQTPEETSIPEKSADRRTSLRGRLNNLGPRNSGRKSARGTRIRNFEWSAAAAGRPSAAARPVWISKSVLTLLFKKTECEKKGSFPKKIKFLLTPCKVGATARWGYIVKNNGKTRGKGRSEERPVWSQFIDTTRGVYYYYNHYTQETVWQKPEEVALHAFPMCRQTPARAYPHAHTQTHTHAHIHMCRDSPTHTRTHSHKQTVCSVSVMSLIHTSTAIWEPCRGECFCSCVHMCARKEIGEHVNRITAIH